MSALSLNCSTRPVIHNASSLSKSVTCIRSFSLSPIHNRRHTKKELYLQHKDVPKYPHGSARLYKKSNFGLYAGARVRFGNIVSKGKWIKKTRRKWWPNVQETKLYSEGMQKKIEIKVTTSVLRTIDKVGGLDNYLLGSTSQRIKDLGMAGWKLRWELMQQPGIKAKFAKEREALGLTSKDFEEKLQIVEATKEEFKEKYALKPVEERSKGFFDKRRRKDVWRGQILPVYQAAVKEAWEKVPLEDKKDTTRNPELWLDLKDDIARAVLTAK